MADLTLLTIYFELLPPAVLTCLYCVFFWSRRNRFVEAFVILMYIKSVTFFLYAASVQSLTQPVSFNPVVDAAILGWIVFLDFLWQFMYTLQEFLTWVMVTFIAVLFGMVVLVLKMALQDPLKMRFSNVIRRVVGKRPESDGYSGFWDRIHNLRFEGVPEHPLDPAVQKQSWATAWRDYLIIGLATLLPSIPAYLTYGEYVRYLVTDPMVYEPPSTYVAGVLIFLTWIYRFGYPSSNRVAKGAGLKLGDRDIGSEMMRGVLGWFFRLNILLTLGLLAIDVIGALNTTVTLNAAYGGATVPGIQVLADYYTVGIIQAAPPILFAIVMMPLAERFAVILYKRVFESLTQFRHRARQVSIRGSLANLLGSVVTGGVAAGAFAGVVMGVTLFTATSFSYNNYQFFPENISNTVLAWLLSPPNNAATIVPSTWLIMMFAASLGMMLLNGAIGHYVRDRVKGNIETFALVSGFVASMATYLIFSGLDYTLGPALNSVNWDGREFVRVRWFFEYPPAGQELMRIGYQFVVNLPMWVAASLFILYYIEHRRHWRLETGEEIGNLVNVTSNDVKVTVTMFLVGLVAVGLSVWVFSLLIGPGVVASMTMGIIGEIGNPDGLEGIFAQVANSTFGWDVGGFLIYVEHNIVRTVMMLLIGPVFWALVLSVVAIQRRTEVKTTESNEPAAGMSGKMIALTSLLAIAAGAVVSYIWTVQVTDLPWTDFYARLGWHAVVVFGVLLGVYLLILLVNVAMRRRAGGWWFPPIAMLFAMEYFVYDDQFTLIALIVLPMILMLLYKGLLASRPEVRAEDPIVAYVRFSLMSLAIAEVLSTALWVAGVAVLSTNTVVYLASILPHAVVEIPAFLFAAAASIRIARDLAPSLTSEQWDTIPSKTRALLTSGRLWRTFLFVMFFLVIAGLIEAFITPPFARWVQLVTQP